MNIDTTILTPQPDESVTTEDMILLWLWERQEAGEAGDLLQLRRELDARFHGIDRAVLDHIMEEYRAVAGFPTFGRLVRETRPDVLPICSFSHFRLVPDSDASAVRRGGIASVHKAIAFSCCPE